MKLKDSKTARLNHGEVPYVTFPVYDEMPFLRHGFSTRLGGVSDGIYSTMNLSFVRGDIKEHVLENYRRIGTEMQIPYETMVLSDQVHNTELLVVGKEDCGKGILRPKDYSGIDGLMTDESGVALVTTYADCVPLYFVDPINKAIAMSHAGWRGTVGKIGPKTVERMNKEYGTNPKDLVVVIGPSICQNCYEVSEDVAKEFYKVLKDEMIGEIIPRQTEYFRKNPDTTIKVEELREEKYQLNLWRANEILLQEAGVLPEHITTSGVCTCCHSDLFFSHRATAGKRGNLCGFLSLR